VESAPVKKGDAQDAHPKNFTYQRRETIVISDFCAFQAKLVILDCLAIGRIFPA
jgi:hypothetical protein